MRSCDSLPMTGRRLIGIFLLATCFTTIAAEEIQWSATRPLAWNDFQGGVPANARSERVASTTAALSWSYEYRLEWSRTACRFRIVGFETRAVFDPATSWVRSGHATSAVLAHEQGHFDIAEIFNRRFAIEAEAVLGSPRECTGRSERRASELARRESAQILESLFDSVWKRYQDHQERYDRETQHGIDVMAQTRWTETIDFELGRDR